MKSKTIATLLFVLVVAFAASAFSIHQDAPNPNKDEAAELKEQVKQLIGKVERLEKDNKYLLIKVEGLDKEIKNLKTPRIIPITK